jgi:hypothetical protein
VDAPWPQDEALGAAVAFAAAGSGTGGPGARPHPAPAREIRSLREAMKHPNYLIPGGFRDAAIVEFQRRDFGLWTFG